MLRFTKEFKVQKEAGGPIVLFWHFSFTRDLWSSADHRRASVMFYPRFSVGCVIPVDDPASLR